MTLPVAGAVQPTPLELLRANLKNNCCSDYEGKSCCAVAKDCDCHTATLAIAEIERLNVCLSEADARSETCLRQAEAAERVSECLRGALESIRQDASCSAYIGTVCDESLGAPK